MKPDQLNRLIKVNSRMQPWFLRNTSELYESAIRTYYERGYSSHNRYARLRTENVGPLRRIKKAEPEPSPADIYPRSHILQADHAAHSNSGQLLQTMMQASRRRSMSFTAARPYAAHGQSSAARRSGGSSSCSSARSSGGSSSYRTEIPAGLRRSRAKIRRRKQLKEQEEKEEQEQEQKQEERDMGVMFSARSMSMPAPLPLPSAAGGSGLGSGWGCGATMRTMPPSRQHHMVAMAKSSLAKPVQIPRGDGDNLMPVDAALKRRISVLSHLEAEGGGGRSRARTELGHLMGTGNIATNGSSINGDRFPSELRFRFQTLGDRIKQFEYIQFADGAVDTQAFNRSQRCPSGSGSGSTRRRVENVPRPLEVGQQPRHLSFNNILNANFRQRSRSLEHPDQLLEAIVPRPVTPICPLGFGGAARGSSLDSSSHTSFWPSSSTVTLSSTSGGYTVSETAPGAKSRSVKGCTAGETLGSSAVNSEPCRATSGASSKGTSQATSEAASGGSHSGSQSGSLSGSYSGQDEPSRATLAPVRRLQLQQRIVDTAPKVDDPTVAVKENAGEKVTGRVKEKEMEEEKEKEKVKVKVKGQVKKRKPLEKPLEKPQDKPRVTKVTTNQVSRSSRRAFFQTSEDPYLPAGNPPKKTPPDQKQKHVDRISMAAHLKGANQLLVASASQVSAYKRAFRTQQQMLKAEILHQQAQHLQQFRKNKPAEIAASSKETTRLQSHRGSIPTTNRSTTKRPIVKRIAASTSGGKAPAMNGGVSKPGARTKAPSVAKPEAKGYELGAKGHNGLPVKSAAAPVSTPSAAAAKRTAQPALKMGNKTTKMERFQELRMQQEEEEEWGEVGQRNGEREWKRQPQQQQQKCGELCRRWQRSSSTRVTRRDADEPLPQLQLQSPSASLSTSQSQSAQQRRQFHLNPPWRPSY
ncbi:hypothetical protein M5D96_012027 [Drosophila gunungcola]|uniref:Uncharacterized protein n=1 Tax=Drosophila gunungcola TaxID=103775 RepID=A0A9P9YE02_9MUSC|nr:hypothetical protein M5D96_012027 [Drosophila gunungcola]